MKWLIYFLLVAVIWVRENYQSANDYLQLDSVRTVMNALQTATHDAAQEITPESISDGNLVFDRSLVDYAFKTTLAKDMYLNPTTLQPLPGSIYTKAPVIELEQTLDSSNVSSFPYHYVNSTYGIDTEVNGPSVVFVVKLQVPTIGKNPSYTFMWPDVEGYPLT